MDRAVFRFGYYHAGMTTDPGQIQNQTAWGEGATPDPALAARVTIDTVRAAADRIGAHIKRTPVLTSRELDRRVGASVYLKCENLQRVGAFKVRGAMSAITSLTDKQKAVGVLTYSSGNHAQGIALAAATLGVRAVIVMPSNAPAVKLAATRGYLSNAPEGSRVVGHDPAKVSREEVAAGLQASGEPMTMIPPYDHPQVIAGQGTAAVELFEQVGELAGGGRLDRLYVPCGGGGLLSGCATVARALNPACEVIGVEPEAADDAKRSFESGRLATVQNPATIADGARTPYLGRYTFPIICERVNRIETASDGELAAWTLFMLERLRIVIEPTAALGLARAAAEKQAQGSRIGVILTGGNLDLGMLPRLREMASEGHDD
ncbi:MAG: threonine dehydratase [Phycisphaerales bacterium]